MEQMTSKEEERLLSYKEQLRERRSSIIGKRMRENSSSMKKPSTTGF
jgi:hypothetical protein